MKINYKFWTWGKKQTTVELKSVTEEIKTEVEVKKVERPTSRRAMMQVTLINNKTDKQYIVDSENDFGLSWEYPESKNGHYAIIIINQKMFADSNKQYEAKGRFLNFSIISTVWKKFDIVYDEEKIK